MHLYSKYLLYEGLLFLRAKVGSSLTLFGEPTTYIPHNFKIYKATLDNKLIWHQTNENNTSYLCKSLSVRLWTLSFLPQENYVLAIEAVESR